MAYENRGSPAIYTLFPHEPDGKRIDKKALRKKFDEAPESNWNDFCRANNYNPTNRNVPGKLWQNEKVERLLWGRFKGDAEKYAELEPKTMLRAVQALEEVPALLMNFMQLMKQWVHLEVKRVQEDPKRYSTKTKDFSIMSAAIKQTAEAIYNSLGLEVNVFNTSGDFRKRLMEKFEGATDEQTTELVFASFTKGELRDELKEAMEKYLDRPREPEKEEEPNAPTDPG